MIFIIAWHSREHADNNYFLFLGIAYFFIALIDLAHTLAYKGMGVFQGFDADLPTQLWISARYMESISLLLAPFFIKRKRSPQIVLICCALVTSVLFLAIFHYRLFPHCFIEGRGLTPFKKASEYIICLVLAASLGALLNQRQAFERPVLFLMAASILTTVAAELAFTFYVSVYGLSNLVGHLFKIISFYFLYRALVETGIRKPFELLWRDLKVSEGRLRAEKNKTQAYLDVAGVILLALDMQGKVVMINRKGCELIGRREDEIVGKDWVDEFIPPAFRSAARERHQGLISTKGDMDDYYEMPLMAGAERELIIAWHVSVLRDDDGRTVSTLYSGLDITERKKAEQEREKLIGELKDALAKVKVLSGMLPICSSCKKIRDDKGYWTQVEVYIRDHSGAEFTHGICPECYERLYPEGEL